MRTFFFFRLNFALKALSNQPYLQHYTHKEYNLYTQGGFDEGDPYTISEFIVNQLLHNGIKIF